MTHYLPNVTLEYRVTGLTALTTYTIEVAAMTAKGQGQVSASTISSGVPPGGCLPPALGSWPLVLLFGRRPLLQEDWLLPTQLSPPWSLGFPGPPRAGCILVMVRPCGLLPLPPLTLGEPGPPQNPTLASFRHCPLPLLPHPSPGSASSSGIYDSGEEFSLLPKRSKRIPTSGNVGWEGDRAG